MAVTKAICNKGFSGNSRFVARLNFGAVGQEIARNPQRFHTANRYLKL